MRKIPVDAITDGMILAKPVEDRLGRPLLMKGDTLQARYRTRLRDWGIVEVAVEGEEGAVADLAGTLPEAPAPTADPAALEALQKRLDRRFAAFDASNPVMAGLKLLALKHLGSGKP